MQQFLWHGEFLSKNQMLRDANGAAPAVQGAG